VRQHLETPSSDAFGVAALSALTTGAGVCVLAYRCDNAVLDDGAVPFAYVMIVGLLLLVVPFSVAVFRAVGRSRRAIVIPGGVLSVVSGVVVATFRPGNLVAVGFPIVLVPALALLWLAEHIIGRLSTPRGA
jgi:hypothetical protein